MKIRYKLVYLLFFLGFLFLFVFIIQETYEDFKSKELFKSVGAEQKYVFNKILDLKSGSLKSFAYDYSFWDEMVDFVKSPDEKWAHENIDTALETFGADAAWVYDRDGRLVYAIDKFSKGNFLQEIPIPTEVITGLFGSAPLCHFFANTHNGLMEFYGAVIQPSADIKREQPAKGYLFCGRLWNTRYIDDLSRLTDSGVDLAESAADAGSVSGGGRILKFSKA
ncbi:MAG: CHASE4 domain-containing protein, partial [Candidatus Omnitrophica bacterium]|nr:CHASE4 domain-containing protein [Candidatus Omnitrophota bacterium]